MIKYIASDLDGTLLPEGTQDLPVELFDIIRELKSKGIQFIAASGRQYYNIHNLFKPVQDDISYIAENGSLCIHSGEVIYSGHIDRDLGIRIFKAAHEYKTCSCMLSCESCAYTDSKDPVFLDYMQNEVQFHLKAVDNLCNIDEPFLKLAIYDSNGTDLSMPFFQERFGNEIEIVTSGNVWFDFIAPNAGKGLALEALTSHLGFSPKDGIAFGDQNNDIGMLIAAGKSYAMTTCAPGVEKFADCQTNSVVNVLHELLKIL